ncbi:MAG: hypothetical protein QW821_04735 [Candidatus Bathyarchaeia archaeon]
MKNTKKSLITMSLAFLLASMTLPTLLINNVSAASSKEALNISSGPYGKWWKLQTDFITILFPAKGEKPMFLWWYSNDTSNIHVVKYKGLIEYLVIDCPYYMQKCEANNLTIQEQLNAKYAAMGPHQTRVRNRIQEWVYWYLGLHPPFLPFSACKWNLTGPEKVTRPDGVSYISFNFTLERAPWKFKFAEENVIIRCRFYATDATETAHEIYNYTVRAGELKMDLVVKNWTWNIDKLNRLYQILQEEFPNIAVPKLSSGLALWTDLASIEIVDIAEEDVNMPPPPVPPENSTSAPSEPIETKSSPIDIIADRQRISTKETAIEQQLNIRNRLNERLRLRFAKGSKTLAGFFDFVNTALIINSATGEATPVNVTAVYRGAGAHMRLYLCYPYFGDNILEHDPSIGVEIVPSLITPLLLGTLIIIATTIGIAILVIKQKKQVINVVKP